jgi:hypothetical protein
MVEIGLLTRRYTPSPTLMKNLLVITLLGTGTTVVGMFIAPERIWPNVLLAAYYVVGMGVAAAIFIALLAVTNAGWGTAIRRVPEALVSILPVGALLMLATLFGLHSLYEWSHTDVVAGDAMLSKKTFWLNVPFFVARTVVYLGLWTGFAWYVLRLYRAQDGNGSLKTIARVKTASAIFLVVFALSFTLASMDWIMSLEPHWYSTIFGIYNFAGTFLAGLALITLVVILLKRWGPFEHILTSDHLHSLGKLIFAFSTFWMYIWFSQYLLIWYANIPEEVTYFLRRESGNWLIFTVVNVLFHWVIPFIVLLPAWTKKNEGLLLRVCIIVLIGHWIDLFWMILPSFMHTQPLFNVWEVAPIAAALALVLFLTLRNFSLHTIVPVNDPMLVESLPRQHE